MTWHDLRLRLRAALRPGRAEQDLQDELAFHVDREVARLVADGVDRRDAERRARVQFGSMALAADDCRDARGIAFVDAVGRDLVYAARMIARAPLVTATIVITVGIGLGLVTTVFTLFNMFAFRADKVRAPHELFAVERAALPGTERLPFARPDYDALRRETSVFQDIAADLSGITTRINGRMMEGALVTGTFFPLTGVRAALGRTIGPADDVPGVGYPVMVLSHDGWTRLFNRDPNILGRTLVVNAMPFEIVGVMPEGFRGLKIGAPDYWAPHSMLGQIRPMHAGREHLVGLSVVGRLAPGVTERSARDALAAWATARPGVATLPDGRPNVVVRPRQGTLPDISEMVAVVAPLFIAFGLILLIGCANVANLLLARALARQREIGVRLSLGASRGRLIRQLLTESLVLAFAASVCGFVISRVALTVTVSIVMATVAPEIAEHLSVPTPAADWRVALFLVIGAAVSTLLFGLAPAFHGTRLDLLQVMRGGAPAQGHPARARNALLALQVGASALLLICASVFLRSAWQSSGSDPGVRISDTVIVNVDHEATRTATVAGVRADPSVIEVAASWPDPMSRPREALITPGSGVLSQTAGGARSMAAYRLVSPEYFSVLGIDLIAGRTFESRASVAILSETTAKTLFPGGNAIGQLMFLEPDPASSSRRADEPHVPPQHFEIIGIVRDVAGFKFAGFTEAGIYLPTDATQPKTSLVARVHGDPGVARRALVDRLVVIDPNLGEVFTMKTLAGLETYLLLLAFWVAVVLGTLALIFTMSGLFSVLSYLVEHRSRELAVRMALGATRGSVVRTVLAQSLRPIVIGATLGAGLAASVALVLLRTPLAELIGSSVRVFDPAAYGAGIAFILAASFAAAMIPARRAARIDPMVRLKQD